LEGRVLDRGRLVEVRNLQHFHTLHGWLTEFGINMLIAIRYLLEATRNLWVLYWCAAFKVAMKIFRIVTI